MLGDGLGNQNHISNGHFLYKLSVHFTFKGRGGGATSEEEKYLIPGLIQPSDQCPLSAHQSGVVKIMNSGIRFHCLKDFLFDNIRGLVLLSYHWLQLHGPGFSHFVFARVQV